MLGRVEVVFGSMFSGKTTELLRRIKRAQIAKQKVLVFKPEIDNRYSEENVTSHEGYAFPCVRVSSVEEIRAAFREHLPDVIGIDEAQFLEPNLIEVVDELAGPAHRRRVIIAGLDSDFRGEPFDTMVPLIFRAEMVTKLQAICTKCGEDACRTQRLIDNEAVTEGDVVQVGGQESYEARCRQCFVESNILSKVY